MNFTMITDRHNYDHGFICLVDIALPGLPEHGIFDGIHLERKSEYHITLLAVKHIASMIAPDDIDAAAEKLKQDFIEIATDIDLTSFELMDHYRLVERDESKSLVVMVDMPNVQVLFSRLSKKYGIEIPVQPTHITLYTLKPDEGIGLSSRAELENDSRDLDFVALDYLINKEKV